MGVGPVPSRLPPARLRLRPRVWALLGAVLLLGVLAGLWFALPVRSVRVSGNAFLSAAQVQRLAGLTPPFTGKYPGGWLYYGAWRTGGLRLSPWIQGARITKRFPGTVEIVVSERTPAARLLQGGQEVALAWDGTLLPGGPLTGPHIAGWGPDRLTEALRAARLMSRYNVESVTYTPQGITVKTVQGTAWSGSYASLGKYAAGLQMYPGKRVNIYPWGVSVQQ